MQLVNLRTFITVSRTGGFHAAAERLNITQAAVSARIRALEDQLGQRLFDRGRKGATLTAVGREFLPHAENISHTWDHARSMLGAPVSRPVPLRIGSQFSTWAQLVLDWAGWITNSLPETELFLDFDFSKDMLNAVQNGEMGLRYVLEHDSCGYFPQRTIRTLLQQNRLYRVKRAPRFPFSGHVVYNEDNPNRLFIERAVDWLKGVETDRGAPVSGRKRKTGERDGQQ